MPRPQFSIRILLWLTLVVAAFLGGILFEKERRRREVSAPQPDIINPFNARETVPPPPVSK